MTLRLVLVSMVAALGFTIPGAPMIESWVASTQNWMNARFADWDTRNPQIADFVIVSDYYDAERLAPRPPSSPKPAVVEAEKPAPAATDVANSLVLVESPRELARTGLIRSVSLIKAPRLFKPIEVGPDSELGLAAELNRRHEGIGFVPIRGIAPIRVKMIPVLSPLFGGMAVAIDGPTKGKDLLPSSKSALKLQPRRFEPLTLADNLPAGIAYELNKAHEGIGLKPLPAPTAKDMSKRDVAPLVQTQRRASVPDFGPMESAPGLYFADAHVSPASPETLTHEQAKPVVVAERPAKPAAGPRNDEFSNDRELELADGLELLEDGFAVVQSPIPRPAVAVRPAFEPLIVSEELEVGVAYELNRRNDGSSIPGTRLVSAAKQSPAPLTPNRELNRAVKLTREAVFAWVSVFTGPAVVTVSHRN